MWFFAYAAIPARERKRRLRERLLNLLYILLYPRFFVLPVPIMRRHAAKFVLDKSNVLCFQSLFQQNSRNSGRCAGPAGRSCPAERAHFCFPAALPQQKDKRINPEAKPNAAGFASLSRQMKTPSSPPVSSAVKMRGRSADTNAVT